MGSSSPRPTRCQYCCAPRRFKPIEVPHFFHLTLTIVTCGIWSVSWISDVIYSRFYRWRCTDCGHRQQDEVVAEKAVPVKTVEKVTEASLA